MSARPWLVAGNWKMHLLASAAGDLARAVANGVPAATTGCADGGGNVLLFPSFPLLPAVLAATAGSAVGVGAQDLHPAVQGAHTGDVSGAQLADLGCRAVLVGHSERRRDHGEPDELVAAKVAAAHRHGLLPVVCVGESLAEREAAATFSVLERQLRAVMTVAPGPLVLAYEPVWAIGTGRTATPDIAGAAHRHLRSLYAEFRGEPAAAAVRILYGGSATPDNAAALFAEPDVDGFLVGGASLDAGKFLAIMQVCAA